MAQRPALELIGENAAGVGYLLKARVTDVEQFHDAVRRIAAGGSVLDPEIVNALLRRRKPGPLDELSPREREVLALMAGGLSNQAIAERLVVTDHAVAKHIGSILRKLNIPGAADGHRHVLAPFSAVGTG